MFQKKTTFFTKTSFVKLEENKGTGRNVLSGEPLIGGRCFLLLHPLPLIYHILYLCCSGSVSEYGSKLDLDYYYICCHVVAATPSRHRDLNTFDRFFPEAIILSRCRCREAKQLSHAQICPRSFKMYVYVVNILTPIFYRSQLFYCPKPPCSGLRTWAQSTFCASRHSVQGPNLQRRVELN